MTKPNFFIVGAPKAGTTAMAHYLAMHPQVYFSSPKELFYWNDDYPRCRDMIGIHTLEEYLTYFKDADPSQHRIIGEGSTTTLQSRTAIPNILEFNPEAKFLAMLRNPIETVYAMHGELLLKFHETEADFERAWSLQESRARGENIPPNAIFINQLQYRDVAAFGDQLERMFKHVPESQRLVLLFDDFKSDPAGAYARVLEFLGIEHDGRTDFPKLNEAREYRFPLIGKLYHTPPRALRAPVIACRQWFRTRGRRVQQTIRTVMARKRERPPMRREFQKNLAEVFQDEVQRASAILNRDLSHWLEVE